ncbi:MAG TPA: lysine-sensitive aspartokinase 3 [Vicinamibacterales bacterium]|nr:lysine-sensitive aspartokinase 3 [Vicinamibacterales bacterium]
MTRPIVMKFGGTSVADAAAMARVARIVSRAVGAGSPVVVVVSAMSGVTDALLAACDVARHGAAADAESRVAAIEARHRAVVEKLLAEDDCTSSLLDLWGEVARECDDVRAALTSVAVLRELTPRGSDRVAAAGELMSSRIVAAVLRQTGLRVRWVDARLAVVTDDTFGGALPLETTRRAAAREVQPALDADEVVVLGGYVGATEEGITTTLGRGGSDFSAAVIGAALDAREIQIWTDVDGMLTADPRIVSDAQPVRRLSFDEAAELAYFGAKVLHPSTILPAVERNIAVRILNTMKPDNPGSLITAETPFDRRPLRAIACKRNITVVNVTSTRMFLAHGFLRRVFEVFERHATSVDVVTTSEVSVSMTLDDDRRIDAIVADLASFASVQVDRGMAIVSAVGDSLRTDPATAVTVIAALGRLPLRMVSQAASRRNVTVVLNDADVPAAMTRLHAEFFAAVEVAG